MDEEFNEHLNSVSKEIEDLLKSVDDCVWEVSRISEEITMYIGEARTVKDYKWFLRNTVKLRSRLCF